MHELFIGKKIIWNKTKVVVRTTADKVWDLCRENRSLLKLTSKYIEKKNSDYEIMILIIK